VSGASIASGISSVSGVGNVGGMTHYTAATSTCALQQFSHYLREFRN